MKNIRKILALLLVAAMALSLGACSLFGGGGEDENTTANTSEGRGLYTSTDAEGQPVVVNRYNTVSHDFSVDKDGNILNSKGDIFIAQENALPYVPVESLTAKSVHSYPVDLPVDATGAVQARSVEIQVSISPANATCRELMVEVDNAGVAQLPTSAYVISPESDSTIVRVNLIGAGSANVRIRASASEGAALAATVSVSATAGGGTASGGVVGVDPSTNPGTDTPGSATPSPVPTATPSPAPNTNNNTNLGNGWKAYITAESGLNLRESPSTNSRILTSIGFGEAVTVYGSAQNGWYLASYGGLTGYLSTTYVSANMPEEPTATPSATATPDPFGSGNTGGNSGGNVEPDPTPTPGNGGGVVVIP